jgi:hypothetical protein
MEEEPDVMNRIVNQAQ